MRLLVEGRNRLMVYVSRTSLVSGSTELTERKGYIALGGGCNPLPVQCKMHNRKDRPRDSKHDMQAIWNTHNINVITKVERPCYRAEYIGRDIGNPHDPIYNAVGA